MPAAPGLNVRRRVAAGLVLMVLLGGCGELREEAAGTVTGQPMSGSPETVVTVALTPLAANGACGVPPERRLDVSMHAVTDAMGIFRRRQHAPDAVATAEVQGLPAGDLDFDATRAPTGLGERFLLVPTHTVKARCEAEAPGQGPSGVCVVRTGAPAAASRCFDLRAITEGRAAALARSGQVVGLVPDGIERVRVEVGEARTETAVVENAYLARLPGAESSQEARITLVRTSLEGCQPPAAMRAAAPTLDREAVPGGVPEIVRRSILPHLDSGIAARDARIWGGGDGITFWVVPRLRCEVPALKADVVCVTPVQEHAAEASSACVEPGETGWIHFPDGDGSAIAGFAPADAREAIVRVDGGQATLPVRERIFGGRLEGIPLEGEVGRADVGFR